MKKKIIGAESLIQFYLNDDLIELENVGARETLLDFLRVDRALVGSKEGCGEGDCGACTVMVGRVTAGGLEYKTINSCICLIPSLHATHVVTVESLRGLDGTLHPVQCAMVKSHASQCGFCTPGIVMSLYGAWLNSIKLTECNIEKTLQGNLCRCTGYGPIIEAAKSLGSHGILREDKLVRGNEAMKNNLLELGSDRAYLGGQTDSMFIIPDSLTNFSELFLKYSEATIVAGATDVGLWITKDLSSINPLIFIGELQELKKIEETTERIEIGACVTYSQCAPVLSKYLQGVDDYFSRIAGDQIRNVGTIGGNIGNGSPIGDLAPLFIGLRGTIILRKGNDRREIPVEDFFLDYNSQDLGAGEFIEKIHIPLNENLFFYSYKISKRRDEDISTISAIVSFEEFEGKLHNVRLVFGGMAPIPKRARNAEEVLNGKIFNSSVVKLIQLAIENDLAPISDLRASSKYRMQVAKNLIQKCQLEYMTGEQIKIKRDI